MPKTRVLIVEDSLTTRKYMAEVLNADPALEVIGEAADGKQAIELCRNLRPDVMTLDMILPALSGLAVTEYVMAFCPTPILIVSASTNRGELYKTYDALAAGAVDVLEKPAGDDVDGAWARGLVSAVKLVSQIRVITHVRGRLGPLRGAANGASVPWRNGSSKKTVIAIGASTGGPAAIVKILRGLPAAFPIPILLVIHIGEPFGTSFAEWLDGQFSFGVRFAREGEALPPPGQSGVLMAPPGFHLTVEGRKLRLSTGPERNSCRPSVDVLFESLASELGKETVACLLTGMGKDGAAGLLALRQAGALTLAQDEASSVVFGMPMQAIQMGAVTRILPLDDIPSELSALARAS